MEKAFQLNNNTQKSIGILIYSLAGGGAERVVSYLLKYCKDNNINVHLFLMNTSIKYEIPEDIKIHYLEKSNPHESGFVKTLKIPFLAYKYSKLLKKLKITHSLSFLTRPNFINILSSKLTSHPFKFVTNERAYPSLQYGYKNFQSYFNKKMIKQLYNKSNIVIANSHGNANDLIDNFNVSKEKTHVIYNPIDLNKIGLIKSKQDFFKTNSFNIISIGRLDAGKNHTMLIEAINNLKNPKVKLYIFGDGAKKEELLSLIDELNLSNQVFLMGFDPNPYKYLKKADLFMFGSNHEGFPNVLIEAMACGLPILSTNCKSGPNEIMELDKPKDDIMITKYGILVPIKNAELMTKGIEYFILNSVYLEQCKLNVLSRVKDFNKDKILKTYIDLATVV